MSVGNAEENRKKYTKRKNQVLSVLNDAKKYYEEEDDKKNFETFDKLYKDLENGEFSIVVVGEFSAGKSTLLNALMRKRILPSFSNETTATVNFLRHIEKSSTGEEGKIYYNDGTEKKIENVTLETVQEYVSTKGENVAEQINHLDLYLDSDFLKDGVTLVDSPGLNGVADGHREITEAQILKSHASIFLFNSDHPGSKTDFDFLYELQKKVKTIIFVLNKIDGIKEDENETPETIIETLKKTYKEKFPEEKSIPEIWPIAAYPALVARNKEPLKYHDKINRTKEERDELEKKSKLKEFEDRLLRFLTNGEKAREELRAPVQRIIAVTSESRKKYEDEKKAYENKVDTEELKDTIQKVQDSINEMKRKKSASKADIEKNVDDLLRDSKESLSSGMSRLQDRKLQEIASKDDMDEINAYVNNFEKSYLSDANRIMRRIDEEFGDAILQLIRDKYESEAGLIQDKFNDTERNIELSISNHLDTKERFIQVGLEEMEKKIKLLEEEKKKIEEEQRIIDQNFIETRKKERKIEQLNAELENIRDGRMRAENMTIPVIERYTQSREVEKARGGLFGGIANFLVGKKKVTEYETITDDREYNEAKEKQEQAINSYDQREREIIQERNNTEYTDSHILREQKSKKERELLENIQKTQKYEEEMTEKIKREVLKEIKKRKVELRNYCEDTSDSLMNDMKKQIKYLKKIYSEMISSVVEANIEVALKEEENRFQNLNDKLESSENDIKKRKEELDQKIEQITILLDNAVNLESDLNNINIDKIKYEAI